jgi:hypothetical protein
MDRELDFTYSKDRFPGLPEYVKELKASGIKFLTILVTFHDWINYANWSRRVKG